MTGLYVHVPFCKHHCHYCNFVVTTARGARAHRRFMDAIKSEAEYFKPSIRGRNLKTLYFGGGTPSRLEGGEFLELMDFFRGYFSWAPNPEITLEMNPDDIEPERVSAWLKGGVNRISLGAQSFKDETLREANRSHHSGQITKAVQALRKAGFNNLNMDLILSMPGETLDDVKLSLSKLLELEPEHISLYELVIEPKTVFAKWKAQDKLKTPEEPEQVEILVTARTLLKKAGYRHYELLNFSKPGWESRHNLLYWANQEYLGLGPGAYSFVNGRRYQLARTVDEYYEKVDTGNWKPAEEEELSPERRDVESFILAMRLEEGGSRERFKNVIEQKATEISSLVERQLVEQDQQGVRLTEKGKLFAETVFSELV